jgi:hypothetical protein
VIPYNITSSIFVASKQNAARAVRCGHLVVVYISTADVAALSARSVFKKVNERGLVHASAETDHMISTMTGQKA